ncbi:MAG: IPT/TIG domain-containing protein [Acidobacteriota bacterium]
MRNRIVGAITALTLVVVLTTAAVDAQQGGTTRFVYDDNGRLTAVISPNGEAAVYDYDATGNFTAIRRISADTLALLAFFPHEGGAGDEVTFVGTGFNAAVTSVSFNGTSAQIASVTPSAVVAVVPDTATTGPITIITPRGTLITPVPFTVGSRVRVLPSTATLLPGDTLAFTAIVGGGGNQSVVWAVNGIIAGNNTVGAISAAGLYTAPANLTGNASLSVVVRATSVAQPALFGEARVKVLNPNGLASLLAPPVSLRKGDPRGLAAARAPMVSIRRGVVISGPSTASTPLVSINFGAAGASVATVFSPFVSATTGPAISSISPASIARGATVTLTVSGANLGGASVMRFINSSGAIDTAITASNLTVNTDGTQLTAAVNVSSGATTGTRVIVVTAAAGTTRAVPAGANTITIQ